MPGKESEELVEKIYTELEKEILDINLNEIKVTILDQEVTLIVDVEFTQADQSVLHKVI